MLGHQNPLSNMSTLTNLSQLPPLATSHENNNVIPQIDPEPGSRHSAMSLTPPVDPSAPPLGHAFHQIPSRHTSSHRQTPPHEYQPTHVTYRPPQLRDS